MIFRPGLAKYSRSLSCRPGFPRENNVEQPMNHKMRSVFFRYVIQIFTSFLSRPNVNLFSFIGKDIYTGQVLSHLRGGHVFASDREGAKQSHLFMHYFWRLLRRCAPRNDCTCQRLSYYRDKARDPSWGGNQGISMADAHKMCSASQVRFYPAYK